MKLLLDQNLPSRVLRELTVAFPGSAHVRDLGLREASDLEIWEYAAKHQYSVLTKDIDFRDIVAVRGFPPKVILVRWGNLSNNRLVQRLADGIELIRGFLEDNENGHLELL